MHEYVHRSIVQHHGVTSIYHTCVYVSLRLAFLRIVTTCGIVHNTGQGTCLTEMSSFASTLMLCG